MNGNPLSTDTLIHRLRMMAASGGPLTDDRTNVLLQAADRLEDYAERIAIMTENDPLSEDALNFPTGGDGE